MALDTVNNIIAESDMRKADLIIYGIKFPWDKPSDLIKMLGQQAATSTTDTPSTSNIQLKKGTVRTPGATAETFVVDTYWRLLDEAIYEGLRRAVQEQVKIGIWRFDFNLKQDDPKTPGSFIVPARYGQAYPNGVPDTEAVNNLLHSNVTYNIEGETKDGVTLQAELDPDIYKVGLSMYDFAHNTDVGGTADPKPTALEAYLKANGGSTTTGTGTGSQN
ncbi:phage tail protein [Limosilactobacillus sp.]|jgi:hypothetical protein|uniref:phage tail protein n=1 Tax=Limosilactobacillus sp. TaxID=2773925 RepID=UPI0025BA0F58|nr:phage tail protein [Limosilactobacillus sp.]MCH3922384.1 phage tail protein [Limosilactobacillus sp.]MCH3929156.1 phage tail protein [Limosilactobacillus sp.]